MIFFSQETKKLESVFCLVFFFILQCLRLFSIDLVRIFFVFFVLLCNFYGAGGREDQRVKMVIISSLLICEFFILEGQKIKPKNAEEVVQ